MDERRSDERRPGWWWAYDEIFDRPDLKWYARLVYCALCRLASHQRDCWPSLPRLATMTGLSVSSVQRGLEQLIATGFIAKTRRMDAAGDPTSNLYSLLDRSRGGGVSETPGGVTQTPGSGQSDTRVVSVGPPKDYLPEGLPTEGLLFGLRAPKPIDTSFDAFWSAYPKKRHKPAARRAWKAVEGDRVLQPILAGLRRWQGSTQWSRDMIEDAATFLRERQWEDEPDARVDQTAAERAAEIAAALKGKA